MKKFAKKMCGLLAIACVLGICGCDTAPESNSALGFYLDTVITITGYADKATLENAVALCGEYENTGDRQEATHFFRKFLHSLIITSFILI